MKISQTNNSTVLWRENSATRATSLSTDKVQEIASSGRLVDDKQAKFTHSQKESANTNATMYSLARSKVASSTYEKITFQQAPGAKAVPHQQAINKQSPTNQTLTNKTFINKVMPQRRESDLQGDRFSQENARASGFMGTVNSRLHQTAISTYRSHQLLERRDQFIASVGIREIA